MNIVIAVGSLVVIGLLLYWLTESAGQCWLSRLGVIILISAMLAPGDFGALMIRGGMIAWLTGRLIARHKRRWPLPDIQC